MYFKIIKTLEHFTVDMEYGFDRGISSRTGRVGSRENDASELYCRNREP